MDNMILEHLLEGCLKAHRHAELVSASRTGKPYPESDYASFEYILSHLKKPALNSDGSLMEWNREVEEVEAGHRHISHLYGLFPGHTIDVEKQPLLAQACKKTLEKRLSNGGGHTGWSQAWIINFYAQLGMGDEALSSIIKLFQHSTLPNLLDNHPPFQIDGNFGALAGILRLLVQSEFENDGTVKVKLLPALPSEAAWQSGYAKGIAIKGGCTIDFEWKNGKVVNYKLHSSKNSVEESKISLSD
jgi:alpha-L-fucosidase 2